MDRFWRARRLQSLFRVSGARSTSLLFFLPQETGPVGTTDSPRPGNSGDCSARTYLRASGPAAGDDLPLDAKTNSQATATYPPLPWRERREVSPGRDSVDSRSGCNSPRTKRRVHAGQLLARDAGHFVGRRADCAHGTRVAAPSHFRSAVYDLQPFSHHHAGRPRSERVAKEACWLLAGGCVMRGLNSSALLRLP